MTESNKQAIIEVSEQWFSLTLEEVSQSFGVSRETIVTIIDEGIIKPSGERESEWVFDNQAICIIRKFLRLQNDLGVNFAGAALAIELMDEIEQLKLKIQQLSS